MMDFDRASENYDSTFTHTSVGKAQREHVYACLSDLSDGLHKVLELNCGTGEDASWLSAKGFEVCATDISEGMIQQAQSKYLELDFRVLAIQEIKNINQQFDLVFSNFGGLNCLPENELKQAFDDLNTLVLPNGSLSIVIMGKKCFWDNFYLFCKGKWRKMYRRNTKNALAVDVDGVSVLTYYYSPKEIQKLAEGNWRIQKVKPIGLFVPPSFLSPFFDRKPRLLAFCKRMDRIFSSARLANYADHFYIELIKQGS